VVANSARGHIELSLSGRKTSEESFESKEGIILIKGWLIQVENIAQAYIVLKERRKHKESIRRELGEGYASSPSKGVC